MQLARFLNKVFNKGGFILIDAYSKEYIIGEFSGEKIIIGYNSEYLKDIVSHISGETVEIKLNNSVSAALFEETPKRENVKSLMLLMPIRLND